MTEMGQRSRAAHIDSTHAPRRAAWSAILPILAQFLAQFLAGGGPIIADTIAQFGDVAFEVEFIFFEPGDVELLARGTAFELAGDVLLVVAHDSGGY